MKLSDAAIEFTGMQNFDLDVGVALDDVGADGRPACSCADDAAS